MDMGGKRKYDLQLKIIARGDVATTWSRSQTLRPTGQSTQTVIQFIEPLKNNNNSHKHE